MKSLKKNDTIKFVFIFVVFSILLFLFVYWNWKHFSLSHENFETKFPPNFNLEQMVEEVGFDTLYNESSKYQDISIIKIRPNKYGYKKCLLLNDEIQLCSNDEKLYHELIVHFPMSYLKESKRVLIVGGGDLMTLREVMKYNIKRVDMLELDKKVIDVSLKYFKENNISTYKNDSRVHIHIGDALKTILKLQNNYYDIVIIDVTEDSDNNSPVEDLAFFKICKQKMRPDGILVKNGHVVKNMPSDISARKDKIFQDLRKLFQKVNVFKVDIPTYEDAQEYKFIMCSDKYDFSSKRENVETKKLSSSLKEYEYSKHGKYCIT